MRILVLFFFIAFQFVVRAQDTLLLETYGEINNIEERYNGNYTIHNDLFGFRSIRYFENGRQEGIQKTVDKDGVVVMAYFIEDSTLMWWEYYNLDGSVFSTINCKNGEPYNGTFPLKSEGFGFDFLMAYAFRSSDREFELAHFKNGKLIFLDSYYNATQAKIKLGEKMQSYVTFDSLGNVLGVASFKKPVSNIADMPFYGDRFDFMENKVYQKHSYELGSLKSITYYHYQTGIIWKIEHYSKDEIVKVEGFYQNGKPKYIEEIKGTLFKQVSFNKLGDPDASFQSDLEFEKIGGMTFTTKINKEGVYVKEEMVYELVASEYRDQFLVTELDYYKDGRIYKQALLLKDTFLVYEKDNNGLAVYYNPLNQEYVTANYTDNRAVDGTEIRYTLSNDTYEEYIEVYAITNYKNGKKDGLYQKYWLNEIEEECTYQNGEKQGYCKYYNDGELVDEIFYDQGRVDSVLYTYYRDEKLACKIKYSCPSEGEIFLNSIFSYNYFRTCPLEDDLETFEDVYEKYGDATYRAVIQDGKVVELKLVY